MSAVVTKVVFVVDDEPGLCDVLQDYFEDRGYEVHTATDGAAALAKLRQLPQLPCIVICDVMMPVMGGPALHQAVKGDPKLQSIPFIFMSTDPSIGPPNEPFMSKPLDLDAILEVVSKCCGRDQRQFG